MKSGLLVGAGFLLGTVGLKALTSQKAKRVYVQGLVQGMRAKEEIQTVVDEARAEFDDLVAEASYVKNTKDSAASTPTTTTEASTSDEASTNDAAIVSTQEAAKTTPIADETVKQVKKTLDAVTDTDEPGSSSGHGAGKGAGKGGHGHGHGRGRGGK